MKKFLTFTISAILFLMAPLSLGNAAYVERYACILNDDVYFYPTETAEGLFTLPKTYYVKVISEGKSFTAIEYLTDGEHTKRLVGYCRTEQLTFVDYIPVNPYLYATFDVTYTAERSDASDGMLNKITLTCAYYGAYSIGSKEYAYVLQEGAYGYVPMPEDFSYPTNSEYAERHAKDEGQNDEARPMQIAILIVLCLLVPLLAAIVLRTSKRTSFDDGEE